MSTHPLNQRLVLMNALPDSLRCMVRAVEERLDEADEAFRNGEVTAEQLSSFVAVVRLAMHRLPVEQTAV